MSKLKLGQKNILKAAWKVDFGMYLEGGGYDGKILLPERYVPEDLEVGDDIEVFLYLDNEERLIATTLEPKAMVGDFAYLEVAWVNEYGAFLDWGLMKDLFCPFREQKMRMQQGRSYIVHVHIDEESYRIMASAKVEHYLQPLPIDPQPSSPLKGRAPEPSLALPKKKNPEPSLALEADSPPASNDHVSSGVSTGEPRLYNVGDEVQLLIWQKTDLGFKVIIDNAYAGLIYDTQIFQQLHTGDKVKGYISNIRPDGKVDCALQLGGHQHTIDFAEHLLRYLETRGGRCHLGDKSSAEDIKSQFGVSKRTYKQAIGDLYKRHLIRITETGIELI